MSAGSRMVEGMARVSIQELREHTRRVVERVREGEEVVLTRYGEPVARIVPLGGRRYLTRDELLATPLADAAMARDIAALGSEETDNLGPIR